MRRLKEGKNKDEEKRGKRGRMQVYQVGKSQQAAKGVIGKGTK